MERRKRTALITLCVIAAIVVAAVVTVRVLLTRERLLAMVLPKVEKAVNAKVSIGDIGIRFPFGFGVDITDLSFEKTLPDSSSVAVSSGTVTVRASLMSLIKRRPEITAADVRGGSVAMFNPKRRIDLNLRGLESHFSMRPAAEEFSMNARAAIDSVLIAARGKPPAVVLDRITFDGKLASDRDFTKLRIDESTVGWDKLLAASIKGEVTDMKTRPRVALNIESAERPLGPVVDRIRTFKLRELSPERTEARVAPEAPPVPLEIGGGVASFRASVEGFAKEPPTMNLSFEVTVRDLALKAGELASVGALSADVKGQGAAVAWTGLFPSASKPMTPAQIAAAWKAIKLEGTVGVADASFTAQSGGAAQSGAPQAGSAPQPGGAPQGGTAPQSPLRVSALKANAELSGGDVKSVSGEFLIGSSPFRFSAALLNIMPAAAELASIAQTLAKTGSAQAVTDLGPFLDRMVNVPTITIEASGRSFDARPYEKPLVGKKEGEAPSSAPAGAPKASSPGGPGAILALKNTTFSAKLDSIIAREAVITDIALKGTIRDGRIKLDPATFNYAGGTGRAIVTADVRKPARVETKVEFGVDNVEAGRALGAFSSLGEFVDGRFTLKSNAQLTGGPDVNPLLSLTAAGSALSTKGTLTLEKFLAPLATIQSLDITPFKKFDFRDWTGSFFVKDGRFYSDSWKINSTRGAWDIKGSFGFDGSLDYAVRVVLPPDVQAQMKGLDKYKQAFDLMRDKSGNLILDIHIGGTAKRPSASFDLTGARNKMQQRMVDEAKKKLDRFLKR